MESIFSSAFEGFDDISDHLIEFAETRLGKVLPDSYKSLLSISNGGYLKKNAFSTKVKNYSGEGYVPIATIHGISKNIDDSNGILITEYMTNEWDLPPDLVLLHGDGHTWIALDYRVSAATPSVIFLDVEMEQEIVLKPSFQQFIEGLIEEPE